MDNNIGRRSSKIFISHSSKDIQYVRPFVDLLSRVGVTQNKMICTSIEVYGIKGDEDIYECLKKQFREYDLWVIYMLSDNYYSSTVCMNEMGASWVLQHHYTSVLLPKFDFSNIEGVISQRSQISIKLDSDESVLKNALNDLYARIVNTILPPEVGYSQTLWEQHRNDFMKKIFKMDYCWHKLSQYENQGKPHEDWIPVLKELINISPDSYDAIYILGTIYLELEDHEKAMQCFRKVEKAAHDKELAAKAAEKRRGQ